MRLTIESNFGLGSGDYLERDDLDRAQRLINEFLVFVNSNDVGSDAVDEIELPVPKALLVRAFCIIVAAERRPDVRNLLIKAGETLAQYQPGLGERIGIRTCLALGRPEPAPSRRTARRRAHTLRTIAEERVDLAETYLRAVSRSLN